MKKTFAIGILMLCMASCSEQKKPVAKRVFTDEIRLKTTPVKHQGHSSLCWIYAMLATIETEHLMRGDSVHLSPIFVFRQFLESQAETLYLTQGTRTFSQRGMVTMTLDLIHRHGLQPYDYYHAYQRTNLKTLEKHVNALVQQAVARRAGLEKFRDRLTALLDENLGHTPQFVHMLGAEYTSLEFGRSLCLDDEYEALTSFTHHPYGEKFVLEVTDNQFDSRFLNLPIDTFMNRINEALAQGHPVCWEGDTTEEGFSFADGVAEFLDVQEIEKQEDKTLQTLRQRDFEKFQTTDDHAMVLVGRARDEHGKRFYIAKNSWGTGNPYRGFMYLSEDYVRLKTLCVVLPKSS